MRSLLSVVLVALLVSLAVSQEQSLIVRDNNAAARSVAMAAPVAATGSVSGLPTSEPLSKDGKRRLTIRERNELGFTLFNVRRVRSELEQGGFITENTSRAEQSAMVTGVIAAEAKSDPALVGINWDEIDWDAILAFIERLITLIMTLFA